MIGATAPLKNDPQTKRETRGAPLYSPAEAVSTETVVLR